MGKITSFRVDYKNVDGWHGFTSNDLPGLYVASKDAVIAYNDIAKSVELFIKFDTVSVIVTSTREISVQ